MTEADLSALEKRLKKSPVEYSDVDDLIAEVRRLKAILQAALTFRAKFRTAEHVTEPDYRRRAYAAVTRAREELFAAVEGVKQE